MPTKRVYEILEFNKICDAVSNCAVLSATKNRILVAQPTFDLAEIRVLQSLTAEADIMLNKLLLNPIVAFDDIDEILEKARVDVTLSMGELLKVARLLRTSRIAKTTIASATEEVNRLKDIALGLYVEKNLEANIFDVILSDSEISDRASDKLYGLRRKISTLKLKLKDKLLSYTKNNDSSKFLQDNLVTVSRG